MFRYINEKVEGAKIKIRNIRRNKTYTYFEKKEGETPAEEQN